MSGEAEKVSSLIFIENAFPFFSYCFFHHFPRFYCIYTSIRASKSHFNHFTLLTFLFNYDIITNVYASA